MSRSNQSEEMACVVDEEEFYVNYMPENHDAEFLNVIATRDNSRKEEEDIDGEGSVYTSDVTDRLTRNQDQNRDQVQETSIRLARQVEIACIAIEIEKQARNSRDKLQSIQSSDCNFNCWISDLLSTILLFLCLVFTLNFT